MIFNMRGYMLKKPLHLVFTCMVLVAAKSLFTVLQKVYRGMKSENYSSAGIAVRPRRSAISFSR